MYSFIVLKYVNLILRENNTFYGDCPYILGIWGEAEFILGICGARQNIFRELRIFFRDLRRSMHYINGAQTPGGSLTTSTTVRVRKMGGGSIVAQEVR